MLENINFQELTTLTVKRINLEPSRNVYEFCQENVRYIVWCLKSLVQESMNKGEKCAKEKSEGGDDDDNKEETKGMT